MAEATRLESAGAAPAAAPPPQGGPRRRALSGGARAAAAAVPGLGPLLRGEPGVAAVALIYLAVAVFTTAAGGGRGIEAVSDWAAWAGARLAGGTAIPEWSRVRLDSLVAILTLLALYAGLWTWAIRDSRRDPAAPPVRDTEGRRIWRQFRRNPGAVGGLVLIGLLYLATLLTPLLAPYLPEVQMDVVANKLKPPGSEAFPLGTDEFARDVLSRLMYGARISLSIGFIAASLSVGLGTVLGALAAWFGGWVDMAIMRFADMLLSFPRLVLLLFLLAAFDTRSMYLIVTILGVTGWMSVSRLVRAQILSLREQDFVQAARALGLPTRRILFVHLVPNSLAPVIVAASLITGHTLLLDAGLSFLGLGVSPPTPTWGGMISDGKDLLRQAWWIAVPPGLTIVVAALSFNLVGDGLRDALDPRLRT